MSENLVACEFEDSTNCFWNAQEQGNGIGESFVDIDGTAYYTASYVEGVSEVIVIECEEGEVIGWLDVDGNPQGCVDNTPPLELEYGFFVDCETQVLHYWYVGSEGHDIVDEGTPASASELHNYGCTDVEGNVIWPIPEEVGEIIDSPELSELPIPVEEGEIIDSPELSELPIPVEEGEIIDSPVLPEPVEELIIETPVIVDPVPEELAATGTGDVVAGALVGLALLAAGVVLFIRGRKNK